MGSLLQPTHLFFIVLIAAVAVLVYLIYTALGEGRRAGAQQLEAEVKQLRGQVSQLEERVRALEAQRAATAGNQRP